MWPVTNLSAFIGWNILSSLNAEWEESNLKQVTWSITWLIKSQVTPNKSLVRVQICADQTDDRLTWNL